MGGGGGKRKVASSVVKTAGKSISLFSSKYVQLDYVIFSLFEILKYFSYLWRTKGRYNEFRIFRTGFILVAH